MKPYIPKPSQALNELKPLTDAVNDFLLESTGHVLSYFNRQYLPVNRSVSTKLRVIKLRVLIELVLISLLTACSQGRCVLCLPQYSSAELFCRLTGG